MGTIARSVWVDDTGSGTDGSIINNAELQKVYDNIDAEVKSASNPTITTKSIIDNIVAGTIIHYFGGDRFAMEDGTTIVTGSGFDKLVPGTDVWVVDSALLVGTYKLVAMLLSEDGATNIALSLVNLTDAADTAMVTINTTSAVPVRQLSSAITFAVAGTAKTYGVKAAAGIATNGAAAWGIAIVRTG